MEQNYKMNETTTDMVYIGKFGKYSCKVMDKTTTSPALTSSIYSLPAPPWGVVKNHQVHLLFQLYTAPFLGWAEAQKIYSRAAHRFTSCTCSQHRLSVLNLKQGDSVLNTCDHVNPPLKK